MRFTTAFLAGIYLVSGMAWHVRAESVTDSLRQPSAVVVNPFRRGPTDVQPSLSVRPGVLVTASGRVLVASASTARADHTAAPNDSVVPAACCDQADAGCEEAVGGPAKNCCSTGCRARRCREVCVGTVEKVKEERTCWNVECEKVCIPGIRLPWEQGGGASGILAWMCKDSAGGDRGGCCCDTCCGDDGGASCGGKGGCRCECVKCIPPKCGPVRCVRKLTKETYECDVCEYSYEIRSVPCKCGRGCQDGCCQDRCCGQ